MAVWLTWSNTSLISLCIVGPDVPLISKSNTSSIGAVHGTGAEAAYNDGNDGTAPAIFEQLFSKSLPPMFIF